MDHCTFSGNHAYDVAAGAVACVQESEIVFTDCEFNGNRVDDHGWGGYVWRRGDVRGRRHSPSDSLPTGQEYGALRRGHRLPGAVPRRAAGLRLLGEPRAISGWGDLHSKLPDGTEHVSADRQHRRQWRRRVAPVRRHRAREHLHLQRQRGPNGCALDCFQASPVIENSILAFGTSGSAVRCWSSLYVPAFSCCDIYGNAGGDWDGNIANQLGANGNICADPLFCDRQGGDYRLQAGSPCAPWSPPNPECDLIGAYPVGCGATPTQDVTWGQLKNLFRE